MEEELSPEGSMPVEGGGCGGDVEEVQPKEKLDEPNLHPLLIPYVVQKIFTNFEAPTGFPRIHSPQATQDLKNFRLVCKTWDEEAAPVLYKRTWISDQETFAARAEALEKEEPNFTNERRNFTRLDLSHLEITDYFFLANFAPSSHLKSLALTFRLDVNTEESWYFDLLYGTLQAFLECFQALEELHLNFKFVSSKRSYYQDEGVVEMANFFQPGEPIRGDKLPLKALHLSFDRAVDCEVVKASRHGLLCAFTKSTAAKCDSLEILKISSNNFNMDGFFQYVKFPIVKGLWINEKNPFYPENANMITSMACSSIKTLSINADARFFWDEMAMRSFRENWKQLKNLIITEGATSAPSLYFSTSTHTNLTTILKDLPVLEFFHFTDCRVKLLFNFKKFLRRCCPSLKVLILRGKVIASMDIFSTFLSVLPNLRYLHVDLDLEPVSWNMRPMAILVWLGNVLEVAEISQKLEELVLVNAMGKVPSSEARPLPLHISSDNEFVDKIKGALSKLANFKRLTLINFSSPVDFEGLKKVIGINFEFIYEDHVQSVMNRKPQFYFL